jgi:cysteine desulfurase/selenocysteine lyase
VPSGLPDVSTLAALANEFFAALPGGGAAPPATGVAGPLSGAAGVPASSAGPSAVAQPPVPVPAIVPHAAAPNALPDHVTTVLPAAGGRAGQPVIGVPEAYAAALPLPYPAASPGITAPLPVSPYYFLADPAGTSVPGASHAPEPADRVNAGSFGLPGGLELQTLLDALGREGTGTVREPQGAPSSPGSHFYFLDVAVPPVAGGAPAVQADAHPPFDVNAVRRDFPILSERVNGRPLIWFDNAATTQKPRAVIDRLVHFYEHENSNIHRAAHELAARATDAYESARSTVARFIGASSSEEIIFVRGCTEAINLVARTWGVKNIQAGDEIVVSHLEHHANIVPWQQLAAEKGARIRVIPVDDSGQVLMEEYRRLLNDRTRIVSVTQVSNALGTVVPVHEIVELAHRAGARALVDGAQSVSHMRVDMQSMKPDFFVFSGHKIFGPTGIGVVYGRREVLEDMPPWQGGGNMIVDVTFERTVYQAPPTRFEAGTGNIADAVGLAAALDYVSRLGIENIARYEHELLVYATRALCEVPGLRLIGTAAHKASVLSFLLAGYETHEVGTALNQEGIAVRAGHHCAQPILRRFGLEATVRPSLAFYDTCEEVDTLAAALKRLAAARPQGVRR